MPAPTGLVITPDTGLMSSPTGHYEKRLRDLEGVYHDQQAFRDASSAEPDRLMYEVYEFRGGDQAGDLIIGTSTLYPGVIGDEYSITRGHLHAVAERPEIYTCLSGHGLMSMETLGGETEIVEMVPGVTAYVPGHWIHRSVNVGREPFVTLFCYPADSGQDYDVIRRAGGMRLLIVDDGARGWKSEPNPGYRNRDEER